MPYLPAVVINFFQDVEKTPLGAGIVATAHLQPDAELHDRGRNKSYVGQDKQKVGQYQGLIRFRFLAFKRIFSYIEKKSVKMKKDLKKTIYGFLFTILVLLIFVS